MAALSWLLFTLVPNNRRILSGQMPKPLSSSCAFVLVRGQSLLLFCVEAIPCRRLSAVKPAPCFAEPERERGVVRFNHECLFVVRTEDDADPASAPRLAVAH